MTSQKFSDLCGKLLEIDPAGDAIEYEGRWRNWGWVQNIARQVHGLLAESGVGHGPVSFIPRNRPSALAGLVGLLTQERTIRMIYAFQSPTAIAASIEKLDAPAVLLMEEDVTPETLAVLDRCGMTGISLSDECAQIVVAGRRTDNARPDPSPTIDILTSGTTGPPKQFPINQQVFAHMMLNQGSPVLADPTAPPFLMAFPFSNIAGMSMLAGSFLQGQRVALLDRFSIDAWRQFVREYRPTTSGLPSSALPMILDAGVPREDLASIRYITTGAAPLDPAIQQRFQDTYGARILLIYGATEFGGPVAAMTPALDAEWGDAKLGSSGRALPGARLRVRDPSTGEILPAGQEGLLEVVSPRMGPEWIRTSDLVRIDEDGFLYCIGRADGAIMRGGFKVLPESVEQVLRLHPAVAVAGVVGVADPVLHQAPAAVIELRPNVSAPTIAELKRHVRDHLPSPHVPVHWRFVPSVPLNSAYKIDRARLRQLFEAG
jgi:acyl-coenzyme A synthetase/AMP-(fatty) acid ligase